MTSTQIPAQNGATARAPRRALRAQAHFRVLLQALARPGRSAQLGEATSVPLPEIGYVLTIAETLLDHEVSFALLGDGLADQDERDFVQEVRSRTGAWLTDHSQAQFVFVLGAPGSGLMELRMGDPEFPDTGATLIWSVADFGGGESVILSGPGIDGSVRLRVGGVTVADWTTLASINAIYPCGVDTFFVNREGSIVGLPRSTRIELATAAPINGGNT